MIEHQSGNNENNFNKNHTNLIRDIKLPDLQLPQKDARILVFSPHADDETIAVGGIISAAIRSGSAVRVILVTNGNLVGLKRFRNREFVRALNKLGIPSDNLYMWNYPDTKLKKCRHQLSMNISEEIAVYKPNIIIYPHPQDKHSDHSTLAQVIEELLGTNPTPPFAYRYLIYFYSLFPPKLFAFNKQLLSPPPELVKDPCSWVQYRLTQTDKICKKQALLEYKTQVTNPFILWLMHSFCKDNEILEKYLP